MTQREYAWYETDDDLPYSRCLLAFWRCPDTFVMHAEHGGNIRVFRRASLTTTAADHHEARERLRELIARKEG